MKRIERACVRNDVIRWGFCFEQPLASQRVHSGQVGAKRSGFFVEIFILRIAKLYTLKTFRKRDSCDLKVRNCLRAHTCCVTLSLVAMSNRLSSLPWLMRSTTVCCAAVEKIDESMKPATFSLCTISNASCEFC
jgi:hypothetical protein